jgi:kynurenine formamidase
LVIIDLTLPLSAEDSPFIDPSGYSDPPTQIEPWVTIGEQFGGWESPFHISRLHLSAHAGTHVDAPSHFHPGAPSISELPAEALVGHAVVIDLRDAEDPIRLLRAASKRASQPDATPLILTPPSWLTTEDIDEVIGWNRPLLVFAGETDSDEGYVAVSRLLGANRWMAANLDLAKAAQVRDGDLLIVAPLALGNVEGCPCRVIAVRD